MAITEQRRPYEFLARWDPQTGVFKGAHIQFFDSVLRDGQQIAGQPSRAFGVGEDLAFPLADIMSQLQADALAANAALQATLAERDATIAGHAAVIQERDTLQARVTELEAQLANSQADDLPAAIRMERDRRISAGVKVGADWFHSDMQFQIQVLGMVIMGAGLPAGTHIKTLAGSTVTATPTLVQQIFGATAQQMATLHAIADAAIAAGTPLDQIQWPASYSPA